MVRLVHDAGRGLALRMENREARYYDYSPDGTPQPRAAELAVAVLEGGPPKAWFTAPEIQGKLAHMGAYLTNKQIHTALRKLVSQGRAVKKWLPENQRLPYQQAKVWGRWGELRTAYRLKGES
jgi:hypothetical protein